MGLVSLLAPDVLAPGVVLMAGSFAGNWSAAAGNDLQIVYNLWSLAVEEQFYLVWPLLLGLVLARGGTRAALRLVVVIIVALLAWRIALVASGAPWQRIFFATDTNAPAILAGACLAFARWEPKRVTLVIAVIVLALVAVIPFVASPVVMELVLYATIGASMVLVMAASKMRMPVLGRMPFVFLGTISYALYLWHYPLLQLGLLLGIPLLAYAAAFALACVSYFAWETRWLQRDRPPLFRRGGDPATHGAEPAPAPNPAMPWASVTRAGD